MHFETLKKSKKKKYVIGIIVLIAVISTISLVGTRAKYRMTQSIKIAEGTIKNYSPADLNIFAIKLQNGSGGYDNSNTVPESGYTLNATESYCTIPDGNGNNVKDSNITINYHTSVVGIDNMTKKGTKCYLYFDKIVSVGEIILANYPTQLTRSDFSTAITNTTTGTIYYADTSKGRTYYFAGNPTDNWVRFGGFYWRIIRINEDGTIRMIYQGKAANTTGTGTQIGTSSFNSIRTNNMYVGYMYQSNQVHGLTDDSTIKGVLDTWYRNNLLNQASKIDGNAGFCGDRTPSTSNSTNNGLGGTGTTATYYGAYFRLITGKKPSFECANDTDLYTTSGSIQGNKSLTNPIGLITADEVSYAGSGWWIQNSNYYLYTAHNYWTLSPELYSNVAAGLFVNTVGHINSDYVDHEYGVRPVINLKNDVTISSGNGTSSNPYVV